ncbi:MAG: metallophosphoesterase, partial [Lachnospiraceae bacterium]|nr:metallophosphoesterase [Lachnospiraceae bacterium]
VNRAKGGRRKMRYYVMSDLHSCLTPFREALSSSGFYDDAQPHKLIILGDYFDRGPEAPELSDFLCSLIDAGNTILLRGNHEDLMLDMLDFMEDNAGTNAVFYSHYARNGTLKTVLTLTGASERDVIDDAPGVTAKMRQTDLVKKIIPATVDYYETARYVFVHGWIPCARANEELGCLPPSFDDWRNASPDDWFAARWMDYLSGLKYDANPTGKTIVCGHRSTRYGHAQLDGNDDPSVIYTPFRREGLIAVDGTVVRSNVINCVILEDDDL